MAAPTSPLAARPDNLRPVNHYGVWVDPEIPTTGVLTNNKAPEGFYDDVAAGINLSCDQCQAAHQVEEESNPCDNCEPSGPILIGSWIKNPANGKYMPSPTGSFAAIVGDIYTQVIFSTKTIRCALCSPCYPGQGDIETPGDFLTYCLPD